MYTFLNRLPLWAGVLGMIFLGLTLCKPAHAEQQPILVQCGGLPGGVAGFLTFEDCQKTHAAAQSKTPQKESKQVETVDCALPGATESKLPLAECEEKGGLVLGAEKKVAIAPHPSAGVVTCVIGSLRMDMFVDKCRQRGGYVEGTPHQDPFSESPSNTSQRGSIGVPPPRPYIGGVTLAPAAQDINYAHTHVELGKDRQGRYLNVQHEFYQAHISGR